MIYIKYEGRLGNNLFQYSVARILSEISNQKIATSPPDFPFDTFNGINDKIYETNTIVNDENFLEILDCKNHTSNLILNGYFQKKEFVLKYQNKLKEIIKTSIESINGIGLAYRLGDIAKERWVIDHKYYTYCLEKILEKSPSEVFITTDSPEDERIKDLVISYNARVIFDEPKNKILHFSKFTNKILSLGTYSWWIGFLGEQNNIFCPFRDDYVHWHGDIFVFDKWQTIKKQNLA